MSRLDGCIHAGVLRGVEALPVDVEVSLSNGLPGISIIGMPDSAVLEARTRVRCAMKESGFEIPRLAVTVNLSPGDVRKTGTAFDLPIAVGILAATGQIPTHGLTDLLLVGELGLSGEVLRPRGTLAYLALARERGLTAAGGFDAGEAAAFGSGCVPVTRLADMARGVRALADAAPRRSRRSRSAALPSLDFADVVDQEMPKRACAIAAAGGHGLLMVGPPGAGKTMLARRLPGILPPLTEAELAETALIHSVAGADVSRIAAGERPLAAPHHSISVAGLIGGGRPVGPGQASLAHNGVLFLDELPEFATSALQALRQPMEEGQVRLVRADGAYVFPSRFQLVGAANPCPCGHLGDPGHECTCQPAQVARYQAKVGGPVMDRIGLVVDVARPASSRVIRGEEGTGSAALAAQVRAAREFASWRRSQTGGEDAAVKGTGAIAGLWFSAEAEEALAATASALALGGRAVTRMARVARTIADMEERREVTAGDVAEAVMFRSRDSLGGER